MIKAKLSLVKNINYSLVWDSILNSGEITMAAISDNLKLSFPTVSRAIEYGVDCKLLLEGAMQESTVGRKAAQFAINPNYSHILVIITDSGMLRGAVLDMLGATIRLCERKFEYTKFKVDIAEFIKKEKAQDDKISIVGIALECVVSNGIIIDWIKNPESVGYDLGKNLCYQLGLQIIIENNMKALGLGSIKYQSSKEKLTIATLQSGYSGFGASIVVDGEVLRGATNFAGEIGYLPKFMALEKSKFVAFAQTLISVVNPHKIIVYDKFCEIDINSLVSQLKKVLPTYAMPEIIESDKFFDDCKSGIYQLVKREIFKSTLKS